MDSYGLQVFSNVRSAPVPASAEQLLTSRSLHAEIFSDAAKDYMPVAMPAMRFLGELRASVMVLHNTNAHSFAHLLYGLPISRLESLGSDVCDVDAPMERSPFAEVQDFVGPLPDDFQGHVLEHRSASTVI